MHFISELHKVNKSVIMLSRGEAQVDLASECNQATESLRYHTWAAPARLVRRRASDMVLAKKQSSGTDAKREHNQWSAAEPHHQPFYCSDSGFDRNAAAKTTTGGKTASPWPGCWGKKKKKEEEEER